MILTYRCRQILNKVLTAKHPLRIKDLADHFGVSARTIKYDLYTIRVWLQERNNPQIRLETKPNRGVWLEGDAASVAELIGGGPEEKAAVLLNPGERVKNIALKLLVADDYVTINSLADGTGVSRNTVIGDLPEVERYLKGWSLRLERKARHGLRVTAAEIDRRLVLAYILQSSLSGSDVSRLLQNLARDEAVLPCNWQLSAGFLPAGQAVDWIYNAVRRIANQVQGKGLSERAVLGLFVRMCVAVQRLTTGNALPAGTLSDMDGGGRHPLYSVIQRECAILADCLGLAIPESEIQYIWLQWLNVFEGDCPGLSDQGQPLVVTELTAQLIDGVSRLTGIPFSEDPELFDNLLAHLTDRLAKYQRRILDPNPLITEITRSFSGMFRDVKAACAEILGSFNIFLSDADTAYIVLHFQAAYERRAGRFKYRALVVCGTGRGSARLLKTRLENEIRGLFVTACCSVLELKKALQLYPVDLVISVLPVEINCPTVVVNTIPTQRDIDHIHRVLKDVCRDNSAEASGLFLHDSNFLESLTETRNSLTPRDLPLVEALSQEIINQGFQIASLITTQFKEYLTEQAAAGLTIHVLLMVNRLAFNSPYLGLEVDDQPESERISALRRQLTEVLQKHYPGMPDYEITAILRYFS